MSRRHQLPRSARQDDSLSEDATARYSCANPELLSELRIQGKGPVHFLRADGQIRYRPEALNSWLRAGLGVAARASQC